MFVVAVVTKLTRTHIEVIYQRLNDFVYKWFTRSVLFEIEDAILSCDDIKSNNHFNFVIAFMKIWSFRYVYHILFELVTS